MGLAPVEVQRCRSLRGRGQVLALHWAPVPLPTACIESLPPPGRRGPGKKVHHTLLCRLPSPGGIAGWGKWPMSGSAWHVWPLGRGGQQPGPWQRPRKPLIFPTLTIIRRHREAGSVADAVAERWRPGERRLPALPKDYCLIFIGSCAPCSSYPQNLGFSHLGCRVGRAGASWASVLWFLAFHQARPGEWVVPGQRVQARQGSVEEDLSACRDAWAQTLAPEGCHLSSSYYVPALIQAL